MFGFCNIKNSYFSMFSFAHRGFLKIALPMPIKSALFVDNKVSASEAFVIPPVRIIGVLTTFFISSVMSEK